MSSTGFQQPIRAASKVEVITGGKRAAYPPWAKKQYARNTQGLHEEILDFYEYIRPCESERIMRMEVSDRIRRIAVKKWPDVTVQVFGSVPLELYLPTGDIDIVIIGRWSKNVRPALFALEEDLRRADIAWKNSLTVLDKATVPIVKFIDKETRVKVDICLQEKLCIAQEEMMKEFKEKYPYFPILLLIIKQFLTVRQLNKIFHGGINSYCLILMLISFFQRYTCPKMTVLNLGLLLMEFLHHYTYGFDHKSLGISLNGGGSIFPRTDPVLGSNRNPPLYISDPLNPVENACKACFGFARVKRNFKDAFDRLYTSMACQDNTMCSSLLREIVRIPVEVVKYREWVKSTWRPASSSKQSNTPSEH